MPAFDINILLLSLSILFLISIYNVLVVVKLDIQESKYLQQLGIFQLFFSLCLFTFPSYLMLCVEPQLSLDFNVRFVAVCAAFFAIFANSANLNWDLNVEKIPHRELLKIFLPTLFINAIAWVFTLKPLVLSVDSIEQKPLLFFSSIILLVLFNFILQRLCTYFLVKISIKNFHFLLYFVHISLIIALLYLIFKGTNEAIILRTFPPCIILVTYLFFFNLIHKWISWFLDIAIGLYIVFCLLSLSLEFRSYFTDKSDYFYDYNHYEEKILEIERAKYQTQYWTIIYTTPAKICCDDKLTLHFENDFDSKKNKQFLLIKNDTLASFYYKTIVKNNARCTKIQAIAIKYPYFRALYYIEADTLRLKWSAKTEEENE